MKRLTIPTRLLALIYLLLVLAGVYSFASGGISVVRGVFFALHLITLLAITTLVGSWARITGLVNGGLIAVVGIGAVVGGLWEAITRGTTSAAYPLGGLALIAVGIWTIATLRKRSSNPATRTG